jgi:hypothetical protein
MAIGAWLPELGTFRQCHQEEEEFAFAVLLCMAGTVGHLASDEASHVVWETGEERLEILWCLEGAVVWIFPVLPPLVTYWQNRDWEVALGAMQSGKVALRVGTGRSGRCGRWGMDVNFHAAIEHPPFNAQPNRASRYVY